jgi:hypothetical protein
MTDVNFINSSVSLSKVVDTVILMNVWKTYEMLVHVYYINFITNFLIAYISLQWWIMTV